MRGAPRALMVMLFALALIVGAVVALMTMDVPPPQQAYEKPLDLRATASTAPVPVAPAPAATSTAPAAEPVAGAAE